MQGVYLPLITPFINGAVDFQSYEHLVDRYASLGVSGLIPLGTTGESPTIDTAEQDELIERTVARAAGKLPVYVGVSGNATTKVVQRIQHLERFDVDGYLVVCPYYNRPPQDGLVEHFRQVAITSNRPIIVYNIPYRTGVNIENDTMLRLAELPNIIGVKDSCGVVAQSLDLLARRPATLAVLTGEDAYFFTMVANGGDGGILASSHLATDLFVRVYHLLGNNDHDGARGNWIQAASMIPLLFQQANPMPIKYCLWRLGLIRSAECRLPLTQITGSLRSVLDEWCAHEKARSTVVGNASVRTPASLTS